MNRRLKVHLKALEFENNINPKSKKLLNRRVTMDVDETQDAKPEIIRIMQAKYYEYNPKWKPDGWLL
jgi:hypothetical protein